MADYRLEKLAADTIRVLSAEIVQKAKSGHPGMPMGCADFAFLLWYKYMKHNPINPKWLGRDRFVLSAGHGSALIYSLLHLFEYNMPMDELKSFRQWGSKTPGHPEFGHTEGIEVTTGPLGSGFATGVGMAMAAKNFAARTGLDKTGLMDHKIYILSSDGCMMEGTTHEAASLAGHLKLDNIVCLYDDNSITIEGSTSLAFKENVGMRYEAYGWRVLKIDNANDIEKVDAVLKEAAKSDGRPTLVVCKTTIGFGSPNKAGKHSCHGEALGEEEVAATKAKLGFASNPPFTVPQEVKDFLGKRCKELVSEAAKWDKEFQSYLEKNQESAKLISSLMNKSLPGNIFEELIKSAPVDKPVATRVSGGTVLNKVADLVPALMGGSADLTPSTKTDIKKTTSFTATDRSGRNFHFGVRELGMGFFANGMALYGTCIPYASTFFVFSDYMKPALRLAAIQGLHEVFVFTHDSFYVGEDGPTHEPIEQAAMLRTIPGMLVLRPAEANEVAYAWYVALKANGPVALLLTRQDLEPIPSNLVKNVNVAKGAYVLSEDAGFEYILIATGSEVNLALKSADLLRKEGKKIRVVSMPSVELFQAQDKAYRESVLPPSCRKKVTIEAGSTFGWKTFAGDEGLCIGMDHFGASAPYKVLADKFGFTPEKIVENVKSHFKI